MCGIAGFVAGREPKAFAGFQADVLDRLAHRGPDDRGWLVDGVAGDGPPPAEPGRYGLFHRRLSILDLSPLGHQPMLTPDGRYALVFNGEIYNYLELRADLEKEGVRFRSQSDTEVLLHALVRWGPGCLRRLVGMFALALLDRARAPAPRPRLLRIKPLYYCRPAGGFAFASEPKALRPLVSGRVQADRLFSYRATADGFGAGRCSPTSTSSRRPTGWKSISTPGPPATRSGTGTSICAAGPTHLPGGGRPGRELFLESVRLHLRSDVPLGTALSGGIDSSAVVAAVRAVAPRAEIRTFTFRTDEPGISEGRYADLAAEAVGAEPHPVDLAARDLTADLDALIGVQDEPFGSTSIYAQYRVFRRAARSGIKVMLDGQGADEMLAGYDGYFPARLGSLIGRGDMAGAYRLATRAAARPGVGGRTMLLARGLRKFLPGTAQVGAKRLLGAAGAAWLNRSWFERRGSSKRPTGGRPTAGTSSGSGCTRRSRRPACRCSFGTRTGTQWPGRSRPGPIPHPGPGGVLLLAPRGVPDLGGRVTKHVFREAMRGLVPTRSWTGRTRSGRHPERRWLAELGPWVDGVLARAVWPGSRPWTRAASGGMAGRPPGARPFDWRCGGG